jgi:biopolymer transport protein ExbD
MRMRRHNSSGSEEGSHGIDLAPMLDFVMNLLIFFIITAIFVKEFGLEVNRPTAINTPTNPEENKNIMVQILDTGEIFVDNRVVDMRAVRANVERLKALNPDAGALILADDQAKTGVVMGVVDQIRLGGVFNITFSTGS